MSLDCYHLTDIRKQHLLFQIEEYELDEIAEVLSTFKKATGLYINLYDDVKLYQDHVKLLLSLINSSLSGIWDKNRKLIRQGLLSKFNVSKDGFLMVGD